MASKRNAHSVERERARRQRDAELEGVTPVATTRREAARTCAWCDGPLQVKSVGRIPKWCSPACRQRAWEQSRAAASGRSAIQVVERVVQASEPPPTARTIPTHGEWAPLLRELAAQLDAGRIYRRDLPDLTKAVATLFSAFDRHPSTPTRRA